MAIASAVHLRGHRLIYGSGCSPALGSFANTSFPNFHQGYGRPQVSNVLEFREDTAEHFFLHIAGHDLASTTNSLGDPLSGESGEEHSYSFCHRRATNSSSSSSSQLRISLVWTDAPRTLGAFTQLVNDLDLEVQYKGELHRGNGAQSADRLNTVKSIAFSSQRLIVFLSRQVETVDLFIDASANDVVVVVKAVAINVGPQPYSVVVTGPVRMATCEQV
jgi:hypothetical protein